MFFESLQEMASLVPDTSAEVATPVDTPSLFEIPSFDEYQEVYKPHESAAAYSYHVAIGDDVLNFADSLQPFSYDPHIADYIRNLEEWVARWEDQFLRTNTLSATHLEELRELTREIERHVAQS